MELIERTTYKLIIKKEDSSVYWTEYFNDIESLNKWLTEEQTRPYWDNSYTHEIYEIDSVGNETLLEEY